MPVMHCDTCHHEREARPDEPCDWCGGAASPLMDFRDLEPATLSMEGLRRLKGFLAKQPLGA